MPSRRPARRPARGPPLRTGIRWPLPVPDFRSYATAELDLDPGVTAFVGPNGQGKTNLVEAVGYVATLGSHRVATDAPLVRFGAQRAVVRALVSRAGRDSLVE